MIPILHVTPHADDDLLSMCCPLRNNLAARGGDGAALYDVHVLLLTTGENTAVRGQLGWTRERMTAARDDEYTRAMRRVGVPYPNIHIGPVDGSDRPADGELTAALAADMIRGYLDVLGADAWVKTLSNLPAPGRHPDHVAAGAGALLLLADGTIIPNGLRHYVEPYQRGAFTTANPTPHLMTEHASSAPHVQAALDEYTRQDETGDVWGIGGRSVKSAFTQVRAELASYSHVPVLSTRR